MAFRAVCARKDLMGFDLLGELTSTGFFTSSEEKERAGIDVGGEGGFGACSEGASSMLTFLVLRSGLFPPLRGGLRSREGAFRRCPLGLARTMVGGELSTRSVMRG